MSVKIRGQPDGVTSVSFYFTDCRRCRNFRTDFKRQSYFFALHHILIEFGWKVRYKFNPSPLIQIKL